MNNQSKLSGFIGIIIFLIVAGVFINIFSGGDDNGLINSIFKREDKIYRIISSNAVSFYDDELYKFAEKEKIKIIIDHYDDL